MLFNSSMMMYRMLLSKTDMVLSLRGRRGVEIAIVVIFGL